MISLNVDTSIKTTVPSGSNNNAAAAAKKLPTKLKEEIITKRLATEIHPTIQAVINGLFRFEKKSQAVDRVEAIRNYFVVSNKLPKGDEENVLKLWIRGYAIDPEEEKNGYLGNYAAIKVKEIDGKFSLIAEKQRIALKYHPQRKRPKQQHPDWGHPALRLVKKGYRFETIEEAQKVLNQLHEEYPLVSIPNVAKLYIIIYSAALGIIPPIQKFVLEIKPSRDGGYYIEYNQNKYNKDASAKVKNDNNKTATTIEEDRKPKGYFTSMVELKQKKKKAAAKPRTEKPKPTE
jgi:hypothetical protein